MIGEPDRAFARGFQNSPSQERRLDGDTPRLEQIFDCAQNPFSVPSATKHPREFGEYKELNEHTAGGAGSCEGRTGFPGLDRIVVQVGASPYVGIGDNHYHCLLAFAASISSNVIGAPACPRKSAILQRSSRS